MTTDMKMFIDAVCAVDQMNDYKELERLNRVVVTRMRVLIERAGCPAESLAKKARAH